MDIIHRKQSLGDYLFETYAMVGNPICLILTDPITLPEDFT